MKTTPEIIQKRFVSFARRFEKMERDAGNIVNACACAEIRRAIERVNVERVCESKTPLSKGS